MATYCEHHNIVDVDDESLLLDNENTGSIETCVKCKQNDILWNKCESNSGSIQKSVPLQVAQNGKVRQPYEDGFESPEDSPLLIEDCYSVQSCDAFHCHSKVTTTESAHAWHKLILTASICLIFMIAELFGGYLAGSLAVMTDAAHLFSDFVGFIVSLFSMWISKRPATHRMTFGYYRAEVLGAFLSVITVWLVASTFCVLALERLWKGDFSVNANTMLYTAAGGVVINIIMGSILHGVFHSHSHNTHHSKDQENINVRAAAAHVIGDLLQSCGVLLAAIVIKFFPNFKAADPICTVFFAVVVVLATVRVAKDSASILLEASPNNIEDISLGLKHLPGVKHLHSLHMWSLAPGKDAVIAHLAVDEYCDRDNVLQLATALVKSRKTIVSCTIQIERYNAEINSSCNECQRLQPC